MAAGTIRNPQSEIRNPQSEIRDHTIRHFALHHIGPVELRVISDIEAGVIALTEVEEEVLRRYSSQPGWPHRVVSLFVLSDMSPLQRQLTRTAKLPPGGVAALAYRPVVNVYDLADSTACHIFINETAMIKEGYWDDRLAETALLAHEHGHPLAENATVRASRELTLTLGLSYEKPLSTPDEDAWQDKLRRLLQVLTDKLTLYAPREIFTNDLVLRSEFTDALYHLDMINVRNAARAVQSRPTLVAGLMAEPALTETGRTAFLALADLKAHLDLTLEIASFRRMGRDALAVNLEQVLEREVFPHLMPETAPAYRAVGELYRSLTSDMAPDDMAGFAGQVVAVLADALKPYGVALEASIVGRARSGDRPER